jgi:hypothetical protein
MTLVLTKVARDDIAMAADAAITERYKEYERILTGASKLLPHRSSGSCLGTWGAGLLPNPTEGNNPIQLEFVLRDFLVMARTITNAGDLSTKLVDWINDNFRIAKGVIGIDIASTRPGPGEAMPVVYLVINSNAVDGHPHRFHCDLVRTAARFSEVDDRAIIVAGDINAGFWVDELHAAIRHAASRTTNPLSDSAQDVASWLAVIVRAVSDLYRNLQLGHSIGGPVSIAVLQQSDGRVDVR